MQPISRVRFDALAGYCRLPQAALCAEELEWFESGHERVLAALIRDRPDKDFGGIILARDERERFRWIAGTAFFATPVEAKVALIAEVARVDRQLEGERRQRDTRGRPVDFFAPRVARDRLHPDFLKLAEHEGYSPARGIIEPMMRWHEDLDGNFVEQFQTTGFDARIWELYLFATFVESGYSISDSQAVPDFACRGLFGAFCVEATTVNPSKDERGAIVAPPPLDTPERVSTFQRHFMPIKFAGPLTAKLGKRYWEQPNVAGKPLLFAIQDFHAPMSLLMSQSALPTYLYGYEHTWDRQPDGRLVIRPQRVQTHRWGDKAIASEFFGMEGAENVSAVLFSNSGTISKFNRMGVLGGFGSRRVQLVRQGVTVDHDPHASEPLPFRRLVNDPNYSETWIEGLDVFHNPRALHPLDHGTLPGAAHHRLLPDGQMQSLIPDWHPLSSVTLIHVDSH